MTKSEEPKFSPIRISKQRALDSLDGARALPKRKPDWLLPWDDISYYAVLITAGAVLGAVLFRLVIFRGW